MWFVYLVIALVVILFIIMPRPHEIAQRQIQQQRIIARNEQWARERELERALDELREERARRQMGIAPYDPAYHRDYPLHVIAEHYGYDDEWEMAAALGLDNPEDIYEVMA